MHCDSALFCKSRKQTHKLDHFSPAFSSIVRHTVDAAAGSRLSHPPSVLCSFLPLLFTYISAPSAAPVVVTAASVVVVVIVTHAAGKVVMRRMLFLLLYSHLPRLLCCWFTQLSNITKSLLLPLSSLALFTTFISFSSPCFVIVGVFSCSFVAHADSASVKRYSMPLVASDFTWFTRSHSRWP